MSIVPSNDVFQSLVKTAQIEACLTYLSRVCDGAAARDDHGFSGADSKYGKDLAQKCQQQPLTHRQLLKACEMLQKYRKQLGSVDLTLPTVEELQTELAAAPKTKPVKRSSDKVVPISAAVDLGYSAATPAAAPANQWRDGLNEQQAEAFDLALFWFANKPEQPFVLTGSAGTGKSFTLQRIIHGIRAAAGRRIRVALVAPTHKARAVLQRFADGAELNDVHITTLHSLLHVMPGKADHNGKTKLEINSYSQEKHYREFDLVCIDEASMIGEELLSFVPKHTPTIYMGDRCQLCPVETEQDGEPQDSPIFDLPCGINLTQVMRYDGAIAQYATAMREDISAQFAPRASRFVESSGNLEVISDRRSWEAEIIKAFGANDAVNNPDGVRVLAWTNKRVAELNKLIRDHFFDPSQEFCIGERLIAKEPVLLNDGSRKEVLMQTCQEATIEDLHHQTLKVNVQGSGLDAIFVDQVVLQLSGIELPVGVVDRQSWDTASNYLKALKKAILATDDKDDRRQLWRDWYQVLETLNLVVKGNAVLHRLQYAFSQTCHQSQGSTYGHVFVDQSNIFGCRHPKTRNQLLYVAATRAAERLTVFSKV